jgi:Cu-Zn family superoxide dismutase
MRHFRTSIISITVVVTGSVIAACAPADRADDATDEAPAVTSAVAVLHPTEGNAATGTVRFEATAVGVEITTELEGLSPGDHGFHVHEYGDCSALDGTSAGGHFNPEGVPHAGPDAAERHVGDLGNVTADSAGRVRSTWTDLVIALDGPHSIVGRAVVVHGGADDLTSQPSGAAGPRVACGVVGRR